MSPLRQFGDSSSAPRLGVVERVDAYDVFLSAPMVDPGDVAVRFEQGTLSLTSETVRACNRVGRDVGPWSVEFAFGDRVSGDGIRAVHADGMMHIVLPKPVLAEPTDRADLL